MVQVVSKQGFPQLQSFEIQELQKNAKNKNKTASTVFFGEHSVPLS